MMAMNTKSLIVAAALLFAPAACAADLPVAKAVPYTFNGYPFGSSGFYAGILTEAGAGPVVASSPVVGVAPASLTPTTAGIGMNFGYAWGSKNSMFAYALEGKVTANNFNGA